MLREKQIQNGGEVLNGRGLPIAITAQDFLPTREQVEDSKNLPALNVKQDLFCQLYCSPRFLFNPRGAYVESFGCSREAANSSAYRLMSDPRVLARIEEYLALGGFTQQSVDLAHLENLKQSEDLGVRQRAIEHFNKLRGRIVEKTESTHLHLNLASLLKQAKEEKNEFGAVIDAEVEIEAENQA